jgi:hypothetical protein
MYKWSKHAKCLNIDTDFFFDKYEEETKIAQGIDKLCTSCPVQRDCLATGISKQEWGVWGGVYLESGKISKEFNKHKDNQDWFDIWSSVTMEK